MRREIAILEMGSDSDLRPRARPLFFGAAPSRQSIVTIGIARPDSQKSGPPICPPSVLTLCRLLMPHRGQRNGLYGDSALAGTARGLGSSRGSPRAPVSIARLSPLSLLGAKTRGPV